MTPCPRPPRLENSSGLCLPTSNKHLLCPGLVGKGSQQPYEVEVACYYHSYTKEEGNEAQAIGQTAELGFKARILTGVSRGGQPPQAHKATSTLQMAEGEVSVLQNTLEMLFLL